MQQVSGPPLEGVHRGAHLLEPAMDWAARSPGRIVAAYASGGRWHDVTAAGMWRRVRAVAKGFVAAGLKPGDRVALMSSTRYEWTVLDEAILAAGGVTVPIYETASADQVDWILRDSGATVLLTETPAMAEPVAVPGVARGSIETGALDALAERGVGVHDAELDFRLSAISPDRLATIVYTSGTTGRPKGCPLTHGNLVVNVAQNLEAVGDLLREDDSLLLFLPLAHCLTKIVALTLRAKGVKVAYGRGVATLPDDLLAVRPTLLVAVPRVFEKAYEAAERMARMEHKEAVFRHAVKVAVHWSENEGHRAAATRLEHAAFDHVLYARVRRAFGGRLRFAMSGGGPLGERLTHFYNGIGIRVFEGYGLTETSPTLTINRELGWRPGTVGRPVAGTTIAIAPDGEILARGPQVFSGYWNDDASTRDVLDPDGWFRTGDIGELDDDGFLRITGRKKDLIVTAGGKNVAPAPLEDRLRAHPIISEAVVIGDGRPFIAALVTVDAETAAELAPKEVDRLVDDAVAAANQTVSRAESIREYAVLPGDFTIEAEELTPTLKVRRAAVQRRYAELIESLYAHGAPRGGLT
jgi:long-chain acyl-CoA synthetase